MKLIKIMLVSFCLILLLSQNVFAIEDILQTSKDWTDTGLKYAEDGWTMDSESLSMYSSKLYDLLLIVATAVAIIVGALLGIRYITAGIDEKVEVKKSLFPYLISCVVVFGSLGIWKLAVSIMALI